MQIHDLVKPIELMSDEELLSHVRGIRHRREVIRPARVARVERAEKKVTRAKTKKLDATLDNLSEADRLRLIEMLTNGDQT